MNLLKSGDWATSERLKGYGALLAAFGGLAFVASCFYFAFGGDGQGRLPGVDFAPVWAAGESVLAGSPERPYDLDAFVAWQRALFGAKTAVFGWHYPPFFLALASLLARAPYLWALAFWLLGGFALYLFTMRQAFGALARNKNWLLAACACPAVFLNAAHGQNGFLTAGLLVGGLVAIERRPVLAGAAFALLAYKPHLGLLLPLALLAERRWRAIDAAVLVLLAMTAGSVWLFGFEIWSAFFKSFGFTREMVEQGAAGFEKIQSVFAAVRLLGGSVSAAYGAQGVVTFGVMAGIFWAFAQVRRGRADRRLANAAILAGALLTTPYCLDYDMTVLGPACAFAVSYGCDKGFWAWEKTVIAMTFAAPLFLRVIAVATGLPLGAPVVLCFFLFAMARLTESGAMAEKHTRGGAVGEKPLLQTG